LAEIGLDSVPLPGDCAASHQSPTVICTLGMHRSGTSLVSRILNLLGVYLGAPHDLTNAGADNPKGYWEHYPIALLNDELLARFGGSWDEPPAFPEAWTRDPGLADLKVKAHAVVSEAFSAAPVWGWKDPRTCLTLPFWQDVVGSIRYVICLRNPAAVLASLSRRDGMSAEKAERLWLTHVQSSLAHTSGRPRLLVCYDDLMHDWRPELRRIAAFIGYPERAEAPDVLEAVGAFLERELCHHRMTIEDLAANQRISFATTGLYLALKSEAPRSTSAEAFESNDNRERWQNALDLIGTRALATWQAQTALMKERHALTIERQTLAEENQFQATSIAALSVERDHLIIALGALGARAELLSAECRAHAVREQQRGQALANVEADVARVTLERDRADDELREIHGSSAWTLITAVRRAIILGLPAGTIRRRFFNSVLRFATRRAQIAR
jgi:hypothetical protein